MGLPFKIRLFLNPWGQYENFEHLPPAQRHDFVISRLENARRREWFWVILVAGIGFFTDTYCIFSVNMVTPMLSVVYWDYQLIFGIAADIWGRRKMYGLELIILIFSTLGMSMSSSGKSDSMSMIGVLLFWRFFMGLGVGADYPLSAVICSEGRMLAAVFFCQSIGEAAAALVALIAVAGFRHSLPNDPYHPDCGDSCTRDLDKIWRLIVGLGAVPAFIALWFRLTIIESPRYTVDVLQDSLQAVADVSQFYHQENLSQSSSSSVGQESHERVESMYMPSHVEEGRIISPAPSQRPRTVDYDHFKRFLRRGHNLRILMAISLCWFCLDLPSYGLGLMNADVINVIWSGSPTSTGSTLSTKPVGIYKYLLRMSCCYSKPRKKTTHVKIAGPNTMTYIIPAELFPTRFRSTCHGIAAASGKLGSIIAQCFLGYVSFGHDANWEYVSNWLGYALLCLAFFMLMGLITTYWIPDTRDSQGINKSLEQIAAEMEPDSGEIPFELRDGDGSSEHAHFDG
ncbi:MFS general substrate transporter [Aspergillus sclerotioniger CBS 115572]|uniref:MFS general substrate transporter n=1 Tax=Aspergillus sclerotioniger CBS 115572 TaxID=1450535 RepID=A0A317VVT6_9EURO|nr:MFS general substrate transporter [Aspergillus sclerotioniger CBS 115572]PWY78506.1 MFS general substrate transporter [Aspergillus sclerotioniger CBS 115572]